MEPYSKVLPGGDVLKVSGSGDGEALQLDIDTGPADGVAVVIPAEILDGIVAGMYEQLGQRVVVLPLPEIDTSRPLPLGPFIVSLAGTSVGVIVRDEDSEVAESLPPAIARQLAGWLVAYAAAADAEPDPAEVEALTRLIDAGAEGRVVHPHGGVTVYSDTLARYLLRSGRVTVTGEDSGNG